jgi:hypothetical protein
MMRNNPKEGIPMADTIPFECCWDKTINWIERKTVENKLGKQEEPILCWKCSKVNFPAAIKTSNQPGHEGQNYLECIAYKGEFANLPTGTITVDGVTKYVSADGRIMTREEFIKAYGNDPAKHIIERIKIYQMFHPGRNRRW